MIQFMDAAHPPAPRGFRGLENEMSKSTKKIERFADNMKHIYGVAEISIDDQHDHPIMIAKMVTGIEIRCMGIPNTTGTEPKHIAQNSLKRIREGAKMGKTIVAYGGGKG